jgi:hypothetical protein
VYITFPTAFWENSSSDTEQNGHLESTTKNDMPNTTATTQPLHHPTIPHPYSKEIAKDTPRCPPIASARLSPSQGPTNPEEPSTQYPGFTNFVSPTYSSENPSSWTQECLNLAALPSSVAHPTLLFYTSGPSSTHIASILKAHPLNSISRHGALWSFFEPYVSRLPNYSNLDPNCQSSGILATGWENDEFAGWGSYTNFPVGLERGDEDVIALRGGVPERGIWFAGEHCAPFVALGTVTGAWWSGDGVGKRIGSAYGFDSDELESGENMDGKS